VELQLEPIDANAGIDTVELLVRVREKRYVLPLPRLDGSSDSDFSYGLQLRWANVGGRNHRLNLFVEQGDFSNERDRDRERMTRLSYQAPYLFGRPYEGQLQLQRIDRQRSVAAGGYDERFDRLQLAMLRDFRRGRPRQGWQHGGGLVLEDQENSGPGAPPNDGTTTALLGISRYDDRRFHVYSETGTQAAARIEAAFEGAGSDFGYRLLTVEATHGMAVGTREHQTLQGRVEAGVYSGGTRRRDTFSLGGSGRLRGYDTDFLEGQRYGYATVEYLRPLRWNWLRLLVMAEAGAVGGNLAGRHDGSLHANVGVGVRLRLPWFVDVEFEAGLAWPLRGGDGMEVFASGN
jgi:outer membrane protein assembly factor BamA